MTDSEKLKKIFEIANDYHGLTGLTWIQFEKKYPEYKDMDFIEILAELEQEWSRVTSH